MTCIHVLSCSLSLSSFLPLPSSLSAVTLSLSPNKTSSTWKKRWQTPPHTAHFIEKETEVQLRNENPAMIREVETKQESEPVFMCRFAPKPPITFTKQYMSRATCLGKCLGRMWSQVSKTRPFSSILVSCLPCHSPYISVIQLRGPGSPPRGSETQRTSACLFPRFKTPEQSSGIANKLWLLIKIH